MSWASRRRTTYLTGVILFFVVVIGGPIAYYFLSIAPTCTDGRQNGGETGTDIGGPCLMLDARHLQAAVLLWARAYKVRDGTYTAFAAIQNPNESAGVAGARYRFSLYDVGNVLVAQREGDAFIMPGAVTPILELRVSTGNRIVTHTNFCFIDSYGTCDVTGALLLWERMTNSASGLVADNKQLSDTDSSPRLTADVHNNSVVDALSPAFAAIVFDSAGNAFAVSETQLNRLNGGASAPVVFTWPEPFAVQVGRIDITPIVPPVPAPVRQ